MKSTPYEWYVGPEAEKIVARWMALHQKTQGDLVREADLGISKPMLSMILSGRRSITVRNAARLASALRCTIRELSPEMDDFLKDEVLPAMGKALRRAAAIAAMAVGITAITGFDKTHAATPLTSLSDCINTHCAVRLLLIILSKLLGTCKLLFRGSANWKGTFQPS